MIHYITSFMRNKNFLIRIVSSYVLVGLLIIAVLTFVITSKVSRNLTNEINRSADRSVEQSYNAANILLTSMFENFAIAFQSADVQYGFYNEDFNTSALGRIGGKLYELSSTNPLVNSIYLFNYQKRLVFSSLSTVRTFDDFYDTGMIQLLSNLQPAKSGIFFSRHIRYDIDAKQYDNDLISIVYLNSIGKNANGAMVVNLNQQTLQRMVMNGAGSSSFQSMILNKQGTVISHTNSAMINTNMSDQSYVQKISASSEPRGTMEITQDGRSYRISYIKSESLGWTFIGVTDYESLLRNVKEMKRYILSVTAILLLTVLGLGGFFTRLIYGPIHRLIRSVRDSSFDSRQQQPVSELDLLSGTFAYLENKIQDLQTSVTDYQSAKRNEVLRMLTAGGWTDDAEIARKLKQVGIEFEYPHFLVCLLRIDSFRSLQEAYKQTDVSLFKYAVSNIAVELGSGSFRMVCFDCGEDAIALVANIPEDMTNADQRLADSLADIQTNVRKYLKLSVSAAMGTLVHGLTQIKYSWSTASDASRYRIVLGAGCLITRDFPETREPLQESHVTLLEKQVTDSMKLGDLGKTKEAVGEFVAYVRSTSFDEMMLVFAQMLIAIVRVARTMGVADHEDARTYIGSLNQQLYMKESIEEIELWYMGLCEKSISQRDQQSLQKNKWIVDKVLRYIHESYSDPSLTVDTLVEVGGLSTNYMRKMFKDIVGQTMTAYLTEYRFAKAKDLLIQTDLPANRIGEMVGIENTNYFYVSFKKHCGKTPDHFRKQAKYSIIDDSESTI
ncbi:two-component system response regulator YesN [Paenibacillus sp. V4I3]|uniref:AraC family transcriptional regulator n=1 Tax=Paenibacillus sp. V4I3 TaxID=3042305 RepID=UPI00278639EE|nr:AraC family transcriptional regulator [Paenibacillus sp. V4I3]MDQ0874536.1 two-component system response regulator YesN [Paenibacillus sp. V4I3]